MADSHADAALKMRERTSKEPSLVDNQQTPAPPYLHTLSDDEVAKLRTIFLVAKNATTPYFQQQQFIGVGGDIRNFLDSDKKARPSPKLLAEMYNFALGPLRERAAGDAKLSQHIKALYDAGMQSGRYDRDIDVCMNNIVGSGDISSYNINPSELGLFIGYRYLTNSSNIIRFYVSIFVDLTINRTRFVAYAKLRHIERKTRGFAYSSRGTIYLFGFLNKNLGCEFMSFRSIADDHLKSGIMITTVKGTMPTAKQFALIDVKDTRFSQHSPKIGNGPIENRDDLRKAMNIVTKQECMADFDTLDDADVLFSLVTQEGVVDIRDGIDEER